MIIGALLTLNLGFFVKVIFFVLHVALYRAVNIWHCIAFCFIVLYGIVHLWYCIALSMYCTVLYCTALCCIVLYCLVLYCSVLYFVPLRRRVIVARAPLGQPRAVGI